MAWSKRSSVENNVPHLSCRAGAGCGKTSTGIAGLNLMRGKRPDFNGTDQQEAIWEAMSQEGAQDIACVAFNKPIAQELQKKVPAGVEASTFHAMCFQAINDALGRVKVENFKADNILENEVDGVSLRKKNPVLFSGTKKLVSLAKATLWDAEAGIEGLREIVEHYSIDLNGELPQALDLAPRILSRCLEQQDVIDFDDMIWFVHALDLPIRKRDLLLVDEAQDLNRVQQEVALSAGDRLILIGDPYQSIYGFRGADSQSMSRMYDILSETDRGVKDLPLMKTFRCPQSHVELVQKYVPDFAAYDPTREGIIRNQAGLGTPQDGSLVLCRVNAPLVSAAFRLIRGGVKANIQGRDIGANLQSVIDKLIATPQYKMGVGNEVCGLLRALEDYSGKERARILSSKFASGSKLVNLEDKVMCIQVFCAGADSVKNIKGKIKALFQDGSNGRGGVLLSSIHRAKGLEADSVYILQPELMPHPMATVSWEKEQERNCQVVAYTRSKNELVFIGEPG